MTVDLGSGRLSQARLHLSLPPLTLLNIPFLSFVAQLVGPALPGFPPGQELGTGMRSLYTEARWNE